jgi:hypothetical protein
MTMGLYYKTLKKAERLMNDGKFKKAEEILTRHISEEHKMETSITETTRELQLYQQHLIVAARFAGTTAPENRKKAIDNIKMALSSLYAAEGQLNGLVKAGKLKLR